MRPEYLVNVIQRQQIMLLMIIIHRQPGNKESLLMIIIHRQPDLLNIIQHQKNRAMRDHDTHTH